jgi:undecaprenyl-diphosphatase
LAIVLIPKLSSRRWRITATAAAVVSVALIGLSRLYLGVHWPTDVAGGWLTGFGWLLLCLTVRTLWRTYPALFPTRRSRTTPDSTVPSSASTDDSPPHGVTE